MTWLKEIVPILITKLKSWQTFVLCLIAVGGYIGIQFYKAQTERIIAQSMKPKADKVNWVSSNPTEAGVGIIKDNSQTKIEGAR